MSLARRVHDAALTDLYQPVKAALEAVYCRMERGGIIIVDDCRPDYVYDGAREAFIKFTSARGITSEIVLDVLGVIRT